MPCAEDFTSPCTGRCTGGVGFFPGESVGTGFAALAGHASARAKAGRGDLPRRGVLPVAAESQPAPPVPARFTAPRDFPAVDLFHALHPRGWWSAEQVTSTCSENSSGTAWNRTGHT